MIVYVGLLTIKEGKREEIEDTREQLNEILEQEDE